MTMKEKAFLLHDIESMGNISRYEKGFYFEMNIQTLLDNHNVLYEGNPIFFEDWKRHTNTGYDIIIDELHLKVECKYLSKPIYESWFKRDWITRDADVYVTSDPYLVPYNCRRHLANVGKKLFTPYQFLAYISKLLRGNKYNLNKHVLWLVTTYLLLKLCTNTEIKRIRTWLRDLLTTLEELVKVILPRSQNIEMLHGYVTLRTLKCKLVNLNFINTGWMMNVMFRLFPLCISLRDYWFSGV